LCEKAPLSKKGRACGRKTPEVRPPEFWDKERWVSDEWGEKSGDVRRPQIERVAWGRVESGMEGGMESDLEGGVEGGAEKVRRRGTGWFFGV
jgi:hypothetical protein